MRMLFFVAVLGGCVALTFGQSSRAWAGAPTGTTAPAAPPAPLADPKLELTERLELAQRAYGVANQGFRQGSVTYEEVAMWSKRLYELQVEMRVPNCGADYVYRMKDLETVANARLKDGRAHQLEVLNATYLRLEAEVAVKKQR